MIKRNSEATLPKLWEDSSLRPYLGEIRRRYGIVETLALPAMRDLPPLRMETLFVSPLLAENPVSADSDPKQWPQGESLLEALQESHQLVVLGDPGGGKTTLSNWLAWRLSAGLTTPLPPVLEEKVPLPCVLREISPTVFTPDFGLPDLAEHIAEKLLGDKADNALKASLRSRVVAGDFALILDGVDEIPVPHRKSVANWVRQAHLQQACVLATSRIVGYEDYPVDHSSEVINLSKIAQAATGAQIGFPKYVFEAVKDLKTAELVVEPISIKDEFDPEIGIWSKAVLQTRKEISSPIHLDMDVIRAPSKWAQLRYLMPFDQGRIAAFAENWYQQRCGSEHEARQKASDLLASLEQSEVTRQLARTPNLLSLMAIVHRERAHLPDGKALLYDEIANAYINTIDSQRKINSGDVLAFAPYTWKERKAWLAYVGFQMQRLRGEQQKDGRGKEDGVLASEKDVLAWLEHAMQVSGVNDSQNAAKTFLGWVARRSGLLLPRGDGRYAFVHLSFQEYFCACYLVARIVSPAFIRNDLNDNDPVTKAKLTKWSELTVWRETLVYLFELLSAERDSDWVDDLAEILFNPEKNDAPLFGAQAALAGRVLSDRHIRLGEAWRGRLADICSQQAKQDWVLKEFEKEMIVLPSLLDAGYAAIVATPSSDSAEMPDTLRVRQLNSLKDIKAESKLRICIVTNKEITDVSSLANFKNLKTLDLSGTQVADISALAGLNTLDSLDLSGTRVSDVSPLTYLDTLRTLSLTETQVADITPLAKLINLRELYLSSDKVADVTPLSKLNNLQSLFLHSGLVTDVTPLAKLTNLHMLYLFGSQIENIAPLGKLKNLQTLFLTSSEVANITPLTKLSNMRRLFLNCPKVEEIKPLAHLNNLTTLSIVSSRVVDISPLAKLNNLTMLNLSGTKVKDVTPLAKLSALRDLNLSETKVRDIAPLATLSNLQDLNLTQTEVKDVTPLAELKNLKIVKNPAHEEG